MIADLAGDHDYIRTDSFISDISSTEGRQKQVRFNITCLTLSTIGTESQKSFPQEDYAATWLNATELAACRINADQVAAIAASRNQQENESIIDILKGMIVNVLNHDAENLISMVSSMSNVALVSNWCCQRDANRGLERFVSRRSYWLLKHLKNQHRKRVLEVSRKSNSFVIALTSERYSRVNRAFAMLLAMGDAMCAKEIYREIVSDPFEVSTI
jgi:hypothetical protein